MPDEPTRTRRRGAALAAVMIGVAAGTIAGAAVGAAPTAAFACPRGADCGTVAVPLDRGAAAVAPTTPVTGSTAVPDTAQAAGTTPVVSATPVTGTAPAASGATAAATIRIAYARFPRTDRSRPAAGVVVPNPGGPGVSTIGSARLYLGALAPLRKRRDLLLIDMRGTGASQAIACPSLTAVEPLTVTAPLLSTTCGADLGDRARFYGSAAAADDLDSVRAKLGYRKIDAWGDSYGTFLMSVYAARYPTHVRSLVLDGAFPLREDPWGRDVLAGTRRVIRLACKLSGRCDGGAVLRDVARLAAELRATPRPFTTKGPGGKPVRLVLDEDALAAVTFGGGDPSVYATLPSAVRGALRGTDAALDQLVAASALSDVGSLTISPRQFSVGAATAYQCRDYVRPYDMSATPAQRIAQFDTAQAALPAGTFLPFSASAWLSTNIDAGPKCLDWPAQATPNGLAGLRMPDIPVLVQSGDLDTNTPLEQGRAAARQFPHALFAVSANAGHTPDLHPCGVRQAIDFVEHLTTDTNACAAPRRRRSAKMAAGLTPELEGNPAPKFRSGPGAP